MDGGKLYASIRTRITITQSRLCSWVAVVIATPFRRTTGTCTSLLPAVFHSLRRQDHATALPFGLIILAFSLCRL